MVIADPADEAGLAPPDTDMQPMTVDAAGESEVPAHGVGVVEPQIPQDSLDKAASETHTTQQQQQDSQAEAEHAAPPPAALNVPAEHSQGTQNHAEEAAGQEESGADPDVHMDSHCPPSAVLPEEDSLQDILKSSPGDDAVQQPDVASHDAWEEMEEQAATEAATDADGSAGMQTDEMGYLLPASTPDKDPQPQGDQVPSSTGNATQEDGGVNVNSTGAGSEPGGQGKSGPARADNRRGATGSAGDRGREGTADRKRLVTDFKPQSDPGSSGTKREAEAPADNQVAAKKQRQDQAPKVRNFTITLDLQAPSGRQRSVMLLGPGSKWYKPGGKRNVGSATPPVTTATRLYAGASSSSREVPIIKRIVTADAKPKIKFKVIVEVAPSSLYLHKLIGKAIPDPCVPHNPAYDEGIKRMNEYLDAAAMKEIHAIHFELRVDPVIEFGLTPLSNIRNKQAWLLTNFRNARGKTMHDLSFSRTYTLGCYRLEALLVSRTSRKLLETLPIRKRKFLVFTLGQVDYQHLFDYPAACFRSLVHSFTPSDMMEELWRIQQMHGPTPRGNISVKALPPAAAVARLPDKQQGGASRSQDLRQPLPGPSSLGSSRDGRDRQLQALPPPPSSGSRGSDQLADRPGSSRSRDPRDGRDLRDSRDPRDARSSRDASGWLDGSRSEPDLMYGHMQQHAGQDSYLSPRGRASDYRGVGREDRHTLDRAGNTDMRGNQVATPAYGGVQMDGYGVVASSSMGGGGGGDRRYGTGPDLPPGFMGAGGGGMHGQHAVDGRDMHGGGMAGMQHQNQGWGGGGRMQQHDMQRGGMQGGGMQGGYDSMQQGLQQPAVNQQQGPGGNVFADVLTSLMSGSLGVAAAAQQQPQLMSQLNAQQLFASQQQQQQQVNQAGLPVTDAATAVAAALALQQQAALQQQVQQQLQQLQQLQQQLQQQVQQQQQQQQVAAPAPTAAAPAPTASRPPAPAVTASTPSGGIPGLSSQKPQGQASAAQQQQQQSIGLPKSTTNLTPPSAQLRLMLRAAGSSSPAPWRASLPAGAAQGASQDARSMGNCALAVADGVAATRQLGIDSGPWAKALADALVQVADAAVQSALQSRRPVMLPHEVLAAALERVPGSGAASCCVMYLCGSELHVGIMGTCGGIVLRGNRAAGEMKAVNQWQPYVNDAARRVQHLSSRDLAPLVGAHLPSTAYEERINLEPGDILVLGTHGLFDMVWFHGPPSSNLCRELYALGFTQQVEPQMIANQLTGLAANMGASGALTGSPLSLQLSKEGRVPVPMQDVGDNTAVLCYVLQRT